MSDKKLAFYDFSGGIKKNATQVMLGYGAKKLYWDDSFNVELYKKSGHWEHYQEDMFPKMIFWEQERKGVAIVWKR